MKSYYFSTSLAILMTFLFTSCKDESTLLCDPTPQFSADEFVNQIQTRLESQSIIGYQFAVNQGGNLYDNLSTGLARHESDGGPVNIDDFTRFNTASIAKFIATIALLNAMEDNNISLEDDFMDYLPSSWQNLANSGHQYTFKMLLTNLTAINFPGSTPPSGNMQTEAQLLQALIDPPLVDRLDVYQNGNFNLVRILIGEIVYNLEVDANGNYANSNICTDKYFEYLDQKIYSKLNLSAPVSAQSITNYYNSNYPYAYQHPFNPNFINPTDGSLGWAHTHNSYTSSGSGGLIVSALDIAKIAAFFKHDNTGLIISPASRNKILEFELGLSESISNGSERYQCKQGLKGPDDCCDRGIRSILMFFPNGVEAVIITNSNHNGLNGLLRDAYEASWISPC